MQTEEELYYRRLTGESLSVIAADNGVSHEYIRQLIRSYEDRVGLKGAYEIFLEQQKRVAEAAMLKVAERTAMHQVFRQQQATIILSMSEQGMTEREIAAALGIRLANVSRTLLKERGPTRNRNGLRVPAEAIEEFLRLEALGFNQYQIARQTGYSQGAVSRHLNKARDVS